MSKKPDKLEEQFFNRLMGLFQKHYDKAEVLYVAHDLNSPNQMIVIHGSHSYVKSQLKSILYLFELECEEDKK